MKRLFRTSLILLAAAAVACTPRERTLVLLSTNDMHAKIQNFPRLATAVEACRDTAQMVVLVDAGDCWTGNAYVDMAATPGMPMIALMNRIGYDVATLGNHEFDHGQAFLGSMIDSMAFEEICANVVSDTCSFPQLPPYVVLEKDGIRIGIVGVVTNYEGPGHPAGNASSFQGLEFPDPQAMAMKYAAELRPKVDLLVLLSHMGDDRDAELLGKETRFDVVIGGHTHEEIDSLINGSLLTQTGKYLRNVGVTTVRFRGREIEDIDFRLVPLDGYAPDASYQAEVDRCYASPELNKPVGEFAATADKWGLANWMAAAVADEAETDIGLYHIGGVRLDSIPAGGIGVARLYDLEPFGTRIARMRMTPEEMRRMIVSKYNDEENRKEAHQIDLIATTPYVIVTDDADKAVDVLFPKLREGKVYEVAVSDYVFRNYRDLSYTDGEITEKTVAGVLREELQEDGPLTPDNKPRQEIRRR
ncbi:bifunctional UDP-sugar hydrolase/5'-nucleotidase [Alistipes sp.]|uniref:bifunctional metallophosphatase/5'-nucleotidase n=1 Tax=Alistipes sp. TaxID=1872444 RepID=UPI0025BD8832|nr:bifunctional UDP-sugar hydrolase/5'-nucleotidase [Alistipes sp.]